MKIEPSTTRSSKTVTKEDIEKGFYSCRIGAAKFIDSTFKEEIDKFAKKELKMEFTQQQWTVMLMLWQRFNVVLYDLYLTKILEILSLPEGEYLMVEYPETEPDGSKVTEVPQKKPVEKKKKKAKAKKTLNSLIK